MKLVIKDLYVSVEGKEILKGVNLEVGLGKVHALMGPNGAGKSALANTIMGNPKYQITKGKILLDDIDITGLSPNERAKKGLFLSFQYPSEITGVTMTNFLRTAYNSIKEKKIGVIEFHKLFKEKLDEFNMDQSFSRRYLNEGFSGGEKKRAEVLQLSVLDPNIAILDETDSGLDIDALKTVAAGINKFMNKDKGVLIITHYKRILDYIKPDKVSIMIDGKIVLDGNGDLANHLEEKGYAWIEEEA